MASKTLSKAPKAAAPKKLEETLKPLGHRLLVRKIKQPDHTASGLFVGRSDNNLTEATVIALGDLVSEAVSKGDVVIFHRGSGDSFDPSDKDLLFIQEQELLAVRKEY